MPSILTRGLLARRGLAAAAALLVLAGALFTVGAVREEAAIEARYVLTLELASRSFDLQRAAARVYRQQARVATRTTDATVRREQLQAEFDELIDGLGDLASQLAALHRLEGADFSAKELALAESSARSLLALSRDAAHVAAVGDLAGARARLSGGADREFEHINIALSSLLTAERTRIDQAALQVRQADRFARISVFAAGALALALGLLLTYVAWRSLSTNAQLLEQLNQLAREDGLTGVANRRTLDERLPLEMARARRQDYPLTVVMLDLDHFKRFNDRRGHAAGDALLRGAAQAWARELRPTDLLARYGGEEFTLVLPACDDKQAEHMVERLRPLVPDRQTFSAGIATWNGGDSARELLSIADGALLAAKRAGRNRIVVAGREPQISLPLKLVS